MFGKNKGLWILGLFAALLVVDQFYHFHDMYTIALWVAACGALAVASNWKAKAFALSLVAVGIYWSSLDQLGCSGFWRTGYIVAKVTGQLEDMSWDDVYSASFSNAECPSKAEFSIPIEQIGEEEFDHTTLRQYRTPVGEFWIPGNGHETLEWLLWEIYKDKAYQGRTVEISKGDTVIDCGAHVGVMTRYALDQGAARVVSIEPDPANIECLRRNLAKEIASGTVLLVEKGVWNEVDTLKFEHDVHDSSRHTFQHQPDAEIDVISIPVEPLDKIVQDLGIERVDFIKMDIEGSEREALDGAQETIKRFRPEMAICTYHRYDDPPAVRAAVARTGIPYTIQARGFAVAHKQVQPKVLFFGEEESRHNARNQ